MSTVFAHDPAVAPAIAPERLPARRPKPEARPDHLRVVRPSDRHRRRLSPATAVLLTAVLFAMLFAIAIAQSLLVQGQVRLDQLDAELTTEQSRYQELRKDVAQLESPSRIVAAAQAQGMVAPDDLVYLQPATPDTVVDDDGTATDPTGSELATEADPDRAWSTVKPLLEAPAP